MIQFGLDPNIVMIGPVHIGWYGLFIALGLLVGVQLARHEARRRGLVPDIILDATLWVVAAGLVGARLFHVIDNWSLYAADPLAIFGASGMVWRRDRPETGGPMAQPA